MYKRIAYWALHYGKEYLAWSVRSVQDVVDELHFLYTPKPSFGHGTILINPDTEEELQAEARRFVNPNKPVFWHRGDWRNEGEHRTAIHAIARAHSVDQALWVDADEVWDPAEAHDAMVYAAEQPVGVTRVRFVHFWRSLDWFCEDPSMPTRVINFAHDVRKEWYLDPQTCPVFHFGYAQSEAITHYKQDIHGHKGEWKPGWFENTFLRWSRHNSFPDVHPTCGVNQDGIPFWTPKPAKINDIQIAWWNQLESQMRDHPYWGKELIV